MIKLDSGYSDYVATDDPKYPAGKAVDASSEEGVDGTPILAKLINDINGSRQALFSAAFGDFSTLSNEPDNAEKSDILNAINKITQDYTNNKVEAEALERIRVDAENLRLANVFTNEAVVTEAQARTQGDAGTLNSAKSYADDKVATEAQARTQGDTGTLDSAKSYAADKVAAETQARIQGDTGTLNSAKSYADGKIAAEAKARIQGDTDTLNSAKQYTGQKFMSANGAVCMTAAGTQAKVVALQGFALFSGAVVRILFANGNIVANPTLNVNNTGDKPIKVYRSGTKIALPTHQRCNDLSAANPTYTTVSVDKGVILELFYDGSDWIVVGNPDVMTGLGENYSYTVRANGLLVQFGYCTGSVITFPHAFKAFYVPVRSVIINDSNIHYHHQGTLKERSLTRLSWGYMWPCYWLAIGV